MRGADAPPQGQEQARELGGARHAEVCAWAPSARCEAVQPSSTQGPLRDDSALSA